MDLMRIRDLKLYYEAEMTKELSRLFEEFKNRINICPESIYVNMVDSTDISSTNREYAIIGVEMDIRI